MFLTTSRHWYFFEKNKPMKKSLFVIVASVAITSGQAQGINDALRFAQTNQAGTARFQAMSGAFGALGGDLSAIQVNPAGSAIFADTQIGVTLSSFNTRNKTSFYGTQTSENNTSFDLNQAGAVLVFRNPIEKSGWRKFAIGITYENNGNFDNTSYISGLNTNHSIADYFLSYANPNPRIGQGGILLNTLDTYNFGELNYADQQAFIGYQTYMISPDTNNPENNTYYSNVPSGSYYQENYLESTGYNGKVAFNASAQYKDFLSIGLNINSHFTDYVQTTTFYEDNNNSATTGVRNFAFDNDLHTYGNGFSFQLGAIAKITNALRAGIAYESPTWYTLRDELSQNAASRGFFTTPVADPVLTEAYSNSDIITIFEPYKLKTPGKWTGSVAYVFNKSGLISVDFGIKDYSNTRFRSNGFTFENADMNNLLDYAPEIRVGAEKRIKKWSLRAGYRFEQSPYKNGKTIGDLTGISGGFGYSFGYTKIDLAYTHLQRDTQQSLFSQGFTDAPKIKSQNNNIALTVTFDL